MKEMKQMSTVIYTLTNAFFDRLRQQRTRATRQLWLLPAFAAVAHDVRLRFNSWHHRRWEVAAHVPIIRHGICWIQSNKSRLKEINLLNDFIFNSTQWKYDVKFHRQWVKRTAYIFLCSRINVECTSLMLWIRKLIYPDQTPQRGLYIRSTVRCLNKLTCIALSIGVYYIE
jgi:hypothetical protein